MENSYKYFENRECQYYPCHAEEKHINCLFCYCPLYHLEKCPGNPDHKEKNGKQIKICTKCTFPHQPGNYDMVIEWLKDE